MTTPRVTITGFRPFPGVPTNPSALLAESLRAAPDWSREAGVRPRVHLLDTVYAGMREQIAGLLADAPAALILTGFSRSATGFKLETRATSLCSPKFVDAGGYRPPTTRDPVLASANRAVEFAALAEALRAAGVPAVLSQDAGEYVCNHSYWHALDLIARRGLATRALFVHLPAVAGMAEPPPGAGAMALETMRRGIAVVARELGAAVPDGG